jgi:hypothetical protein
MRGKIKDKERGKSKKNKGLPAGHGLVASLLDGNCAKDCQFLNICVSQILAKAGHGRKGYRKKNLLLDFCAKKQLRHRSKKSLNLRQLESNHLCQDC